MLHEGLGTFVVLFFKACARLAIMCLLVPMMSFCWMLLALCDCYMTAYKGFMILTYIALDLPLLLGCWVAPIIIGLGHTANGDVTVSCLFLAGACNDSYSLGLPHMGYLLPLIALQVGNGSAGQTEFVLIVALDLLLMSFIWCLNAIFYSRLGSSMLLFSHIILTP